MFNLNIFCNLEKQIKEFEKKEETKRAIECLFKENKKCDLCLHKNKDCDRYKNLLGQNNGNTKNN